MFGIGPSELLVVGIIAVILFGSRLPSVARSLGKSLTEFKKGMREFEDEMHSAVYSPDPPSRVTRNEQIEHHAAPSEPPATEAAATESAATTHDEALS
jgi:sec-independent protein translocase protein TatA